MVEHDTLTGNEIAVIGMAGRFPGARDTNAFWHNLQNGIESITFFSDEELNAAGVDPSLYSDPRYIRAHGALDDFEFFDAEFFGYSPNEAELLDPQHRLLLECVWHALEDAGYCPYAYPGLISLFAGAGFNRYLLYNLLSNSSRWSKLGGFQVILSNEKDYLTTRVSYKLNLRGPSINLQTACSTSLVAVHMACQSLLAGECDMALAGGVTIANLDRTGYIYQEGSILSPDGHCRAFDAEANGTVFGDGVAVVVLKRLAEALEGGDHIEAVIKGAAINNDGAAKVGYTAPSVDGQTAVIMDALAIAGVAPETISYIEAHGTGTPIGDPIEIAALTRAYGTTTRKKGSCALGSVKTNVGHLDIAAGVTGFLKAVLSLKYRLLPPSLNFKSPNPQIDFTNSPFYINTTLQPWNTEYTPRRAAVSSLGIGGTNAHVILEEAPRTSQSPPKTRRTWHILPLSARTPSALAHITKRLHEHIRCNPTLNITDIAYTLQVGRAPFNYRTIAVCRDREGALQTLSGGKTEYSITSTSQITDRPVAFMFPGQGTQYINMGRQLYETQPKFTELVELCSKILHPYLGIDLRTVILPTADTPSTSNQIDQTWLTQPALFVVEYALSQLWMSWGVYPQAMIGHSIGEYVAACLAGVMTLKDALTLVALRGQLMQHTPGGAMIAVFLSEEGIQPFLRKELSLAAINAPNQCVLSGSLEAIEACVQKLVAQGISYRRLHTSHAFHSSHMDSILKNFAEHAASIQLYPPRIPYISNVTGTWITIEEATSAAYWATHMRQPVRFADGLKTLGQDTQLAFLEVGPGHTLSILAKRQHPEGSSRPIIASLPFSDEEEKTEEAYLAMTVGKLWSSGVNIKWEQLHQGNDPRRISLPGYSFERRRCWIDVTQEKGEISTAQPDHGRKPDIADWFYFPVWKQTINPALSARAIHREVTTTWLIFNDTTGIGKEISQQLRPLGNTVVEVYMGKQFEKMGRDHYCLNPERSEDYQTLLETLDSNHQFPQKIAHLWMIQPYDSSASPEQRYETAQSTGFLALMFLAQAIGKLDKPEPVQIQILSNNLYAVMGTEALCPEQALILGPCKVIPQEYPHITCAAIDITLSENGGATDPQLLSMLLNELLSASSDPVVALRGKHRWIQVYEPTPIKAETSTPRLREGGVYLITGGFGGIGLTFAEFLARTVSAKLILLGRAPLPDREEWGQWLSTYPSQDPVAVKLRKIQELEALGSEVVCITADVSDAKEMDTAIKTVLTQYGRIHGVIHAAGIPGAGIIQWKTPEQAKQVLAPKTWGALALQSLLKDINPEFVIFCSSIDAIFGGFGAVDYCAANAFLDALAQNHAAINGLAITSINWDTWQEVGMAANASYPTSLKKQWEKRLKQAILPQEGCEVLRRILCYQPTQSLVAFQDYFNLSDDPQLDELTSVEDEDFETVQDRPELTANYEAPRNQVEHRLANMWQDLLGIEKVGIHDDFFELGGHSLLAIQILSQVNKIFEVSLSLASLTEQSTISRLADLIVQKRTLQEEAAVVEEMLTQIEGLSDEEINAMLNEALEDDSE